MRDGIAVAPDLEGARLPRATAVVDARVALVSGVAVGLGLAAGFLAEGLVRLIALVTNLAFFHRLSTEFASPAGNHLGWALLPVPVAGGLLVGLMARYGSKAIRGHGIPEAMEQVLLNGSRIPARVTFLKPLSAAIAIGTGGPFGAEGPIIATGGALGSMVGQRLPMPAMERKTLLAAGAAAGMAATFGSPVAAVLLAVELLLFELRPRSVIPVALAAVTATGVRFALHGIRPIFPMVPLAPPNGLQLCVYIAVGALAGLASVGVTRALYVIEDGFERLPIHWMWWPALGGLVVGIAGMVAPRTLGVGYDNIEAILAGSLATKALLALCLAKFISWATALGSGTSGGTLAPLFTIGGALGALLGTLAAAVLPHAGVDPRMCALVGMAAIFAGAARCMLTSAVFAFEITLQPMGLMPLLGGCAAAYLLSALVMRHGIMTERLARRGVRVPAEYPADHLDQLLVRDHATRQVAAFGAGETVAAARRWLAEGHPGASHQGFPLVDAAGRPVGLIMGRDLLDPDLDPGQPLGKLVKRPVALAREDTSLREAADHMVREGVGRLPVVAPDGHLVGILTRSDLLDAHAQRLGDE
ncbi:chloride channel protein [Mesoterricola silvestris]|uniref:Chloride channel protein n=1 Tax=Mesoterricola silvestris TaxID=2927979 RepID=A0AA48GJK3_9BACT|nr:chloride channel protein [Mesoterricola silvestris]BDU74186.1 chloride channel protein [Mesoterricola silvestris]